MRRAGASPSIGTRGRTQKPRGRSQRAAAPASWLPRGLDSIGQHALHVDREAFVAHALSDLVELQRWFDRCGGAEDVQQLEVRILPRSALHTLLGARHTLEYDPAAIRLLQQHRIVVATVDRRSTSD